jgi:hypothetical protein
MGATPAAVPGVGTIMSRSIENGAMVPVGPLKRIVPLGRCAPSLHDPHTLS